MIDHIASGPIASAESAGPLAEAIRDRALRLYRYAAAVTARQGILLADTKFEFGLVGEPLAPADPGPRLALGLDEPIT